VYDTEIKQNVCVVIVLVIQAVTNCARRQLNQIIFYGLCFHVVLLFIILWVGCSDVDKSELSDSESPDDYDDVFSDTVCTVIAVSVV